jgi:hypothetical protein
MSQWRWAALAAAIVAAPLPLQAQTEAPTDAKVYIISPKNGERVRSPVIVRFGLRGMGVTRAGDTAKNVGHHHLLLDLAEPLDAREPIPTGKRHLHFGGGQTETELALEPGRHTLQLVLGDAEHRLFQPNVASEVVTVTVLDEKQAAARSGVKKRHHRRAKRSRPHG